MPGGLEQGGCVSLELDETPAPAPPAHVVWGFWCHDGLWGLGSVPWDCWGTPGHLTGAVLGSTLTTHSFVHPERWQGCASSSGPQPAPIPPGWDPTAKKPTEAQRWLQACMGLHQEVETSSAAGLPGVTSKVLLLCQATTTAESTKHSCPCLGEVSQCPISTASSRAEGKAGGSPR